MTTNYFDNKVIWITGGTSGIGFELAKLLLAFNNTKIIISGRDFFTWENYPLDENLRKQIYFLPVDLETLTYTDCQNLLHEILEHFKQLDLVFLNAGISQYYESAESKNIEVDQKIFKINFWSNVLLSRVIIPYFINQNQGHLIVTSSILGKIGLYKRSIYAASKHAIQGYFNSLQLELLETPIHITLVLPGGIKTNISKNALLANGLPRNNIGYWQLKGMNAQRCAQKILHATSKKKREKIIAKIEWLFIYLYQLIPWAFYKLFKLIKHADK